VEILHSTTPDIARIQSQDGSGVTALVTIAAFRVPPALTANVIGERIRRYLHRDWALIGSRIEEDDDLPSRDYVASLVVTHDYEVTADQIGSAVWDAITEGRDLDITVEMQEFVGISGVAFGPYPQR
jgi:hypothetical protein